MIRTSKAIHTTTRPCAASRRCRHLPHWRQQEKTIPGQVIRPKASGLRGHTHTHTWSRPHRPQPPPLELRSPPRQRLRSETGGADKNPTGWGEPIQFPGRLRACTTNSSSIATSTAPAAPTASARRNSPPSPPSPAHQPRDTPRRIPREGIARRSGPLDGAWWPRHTAELRGAFPARHVQAHKKSTTEATAAEAGAARAATRILSPRLHLPLLPPPPPSSSVPGQARQAGTDAPSSPRTHMDEEESRSWSPVPDRTPSPTHHHHHGPLAHTTRCLQGTLPTKSGRVRQA